MYQCMLDVLDVGWSDRRLLIVYPISNVCYLLLPLPSRSNYPNFDSKRVPSPVVCHDLERTISDPGRNMDLSCVFGVCDLSMDAEEHSSPL